MKVEVTLLNVGKVYVIIRVDILYVCEPELQQ